MRVQENPELVIPVASPEGMALLKLIAWTDRPREARKKDAADILYLMKNYEGIPFVSDSLYEDVERMEIYGWDITLAASHQLGAAARQTALHATATVIDELFGGQHERLTLENLIEDMAASDSAHYDRSAQIMDAFVSGFTASRYKPE